MSEILEQNQIKCRMCTSTEVVYNEVENIYICKSCGSTFEIVSDVVVKSKIDEVIELRNHLNFDEAMDKIEELIIKYPNSGELYFQYILAKYGVTFVSESGAFTQKPTLCRASKIKVEDNKYYEKALQFAANDRMKQVYIEKLDEIEKLRNSIIIRASKQQPFDIFICYKRTAEGRTLTLDSAKARQIYEKLNRQGYKVFFAEETLVDFTGQEYEPVIYNALISSKVMLVIAGSEPEYVNAPWVKNEWSRFLSFIDVDGDKSRAIIPVCCNGFKVEDLPIKLSRRQILEYDGTFDDKLGKILGNFIKHGISTNITRGTTETKVEVKPIVVEEVQIEKRGFGQHTTEIKITTRESTILESSKNWLEKGKYKRVISETSDLIVKNPQCSEAAWLYFLAIIECADDKQAESFGFGKSFGKADSERFNEILNNVSIALEFCHKKEYIRRLDVLADILINTLQYRNYEVASMLFKFLQERCDDKYELSLATSVKRQLIKNLNTHRYKNDNVKLENVKIILDTLFNTFTKLGTKGIINIYNEVAEEALKNRNFEVALNYFEETLKLFTADPHALWGKMLAQVKACDDEEYASRTKNLDETAEIILTMMKGGYKLSSSNNNYLTRACNIGVYLLLTPNAKYAKEYYKKIYSLIPNSDEFSDTAYNIAINFPELLLLKGLYADAEEFFRVVLAEHNQFDFRAHLGLLKCKAKCKSNLGLLTINDGINEKYHDKYTTIREAEVESLKNGVLENEVFTELCNLHDEILDMPSSARSKVVEALKNAEKVSAKTLTTASVEEIIYTVKHSIDIVLEGNKNAIAESYYKNVVDTASECSDGVVELQVKSICKNAKLFDSVISINFMLELILALVPAILIWIFYGAYLIKLDKFLANVAPVILGIVGIGVGIYTWKRFSSEDIIDNGWVRGIVCALIGGAAGALVAGVIWGILFILQSIANFIFGDLYNIYLLVSILVCAGPYIGYKIYDIIDKRRYLTIKYAIFTVIMIAIVLATPIITYGLI